MNVKHLLAVSTLCFASLLTTTAQAASWYVMGEGQDSTPTKAERAAIGEAYRLCAQGGGSATVLQVQTYFITSLYCRARAIAVCNSG